MPDAMFGASCPPNSRPGGVAHCISGELRSFSSDPRIAPSIRKHLIESLGSPYKVFVALSKETPIDAKLAQALKLVNGTLVEEPPPSEAPEHGCTIGSMSPGSGFHQWSHMQRCFRQVVRYEQQNRVCFSHIVRSRTDVLWTGPMPSISEYSSTAISVRWANTPDGGGRRKTAAGLRSGPSWLDDNFALVPRDLAAVFFGTVGSYMRCRTCEAYEQGCAGGSTSVTCNRRTAGLKQHVGSECLLAMWLRENHVNQVFQLRSGPPRRAARSSAGQTPQLEPQYDIVRAPGWAPQHFKGINGLNVPQTPADGHRDRRARGLKSPSRCTKRPCTARENGAKGRGGGGGRGGSVRQQRQRMTTRGMVQNAQDRLRSETE